MNRAEAIQDFLAAAEWDDARREPFTADFSTRRYIRLHRGSQTAVLMDADTDQKTENFVALARLITNLDLSAPEIYVEQAAHGLVLMEDFGSANIGSLIDRDSNNAATFYQHMPQVLAHLHQTFITAPITLPHFNAQLFSEQAEKFLDAYLPFALHRPAHNEERESFRAVWLRLLQPIDALPQSLLLRDFMPDNVMDLAHRHTWRRFGLLDFQDAGIGSIAYDLASFCETVRREGGAEFMESVFASYHQQAQPSCSPQELLSAGYIFAAQRHTRILGILAGILQKNPQSDKRGFITRVENYLKRLMQKSELHPLREWMRTSGLLVG